MRSSSPSLFQSLTKGIRDQGAKVVDIGLATTPMLYFSVIQYGLDGGINITGSHTPQYHNGFKLVREKAIPISGDSGIEDIKRLTEADFKSKKVGKISKKNVLKSYIKNALKFVDKKSIKPLKIVIDTGNGMAGLVVPSLFKKLKCQIVPLYFELDGSFPNHIPNPMVPENLIDLQKKVVMEKADLGIALDGDADRIAFVDEKGQAISSDLITALVAKTLLRTNHGQKILYDLRSSWAVREEIAASGGIPIISRVGHSLIKEKMRQDNILFAGELSAHYYLKENRFIESPFIIALKLLEIISAENKLISEITQPLKRYFSSGEINFEVEDKVKKLKEIEKHYQDAKNIFHLDGLSVEYSDWWFNLRPSNTENLLRLNLEAKNKELLEQKKKELSALIQN